jgi:hypothetical protein
MLIAPRRKESELLALQVTWTSCSAYAAVAQLIRNRFNIAHRRPGARFDRARGAEREVARRVLSNKFGVALA